MELVGLSTELHIDQLKDHVVDVFPTAGVEVNKLSLDPPTEKQKSCDSKTSEPARCTKYSESKEKLRNLDEGSKKRLKTQKICVNESLCPPYQKLLGKCNAILKRKYISNFYSVNGKLKIKPGCTDSRATDTKHDDGLQQIFGDLLKLDYVSLKIV